MTLVLDGVSKKVGASTHIEDVNLTLERGSLNVLLGATLSGKTSLMRLMAGLDAPIYPVKGVSMTAPRAPWPDAPRTALLDDGGDWSRSGVPPAGDRMGKGSGTHDLFS